MVTRAPGNMAMKARGLFWAWLGLVACTPELPDDATLVLRPRLLAVQAVPAEVGRGEPVTLRALEVSPVGIATRTLDWAFCNERKPLVEQGAVSTSCLVPEGSVLSPIGQGENVTAQLPTNVCRVFGPDRPDPIPGVPPGRPADADVTGGYFQPVRVRFLGAPGSGVGEEYATSDVRITCNLAGATPAQQSEFDQRGRANNNPIVEGLFLTGGSPLPSLEADPQAVTAIPAGGTLALRVRWQPCPVGPDVCGDGVCGVDETDAACAQDCVPRKGCGGAEAYVWLNPASRTIETRRESIRVSWFATAGAFASARTGRTELEAATPFSDNLWTAPAAGQKVFLWVVVRDDRGGTAWTSHVFGTQ